MRGIPGLASFRRITRAAIPRQGSARRGQIHPAGRLVLGADTVVTLNRLILGKPNGPHDATRMLRLLSGQTHEVITAICLVRAPMKSRRSNMKPRSSLFVNSARTRFALTFHREPYDKAGAYGIQGRASRFVEHISGCYFNVVGLPISLFE